MNTFREKSKIRSYIYDVPTRSHISSPSFEDSSHPRSQLFHANFTSRFEYVKSSSRVSESSGYEPNIQISPKKIDFYVRFLPYIHAQHGINHSKNIIATIKSTQITDSLPLIRKNSEINIFGNISNIKNESQYMRNRSLDINKLNR